MTYEYGDKVIYKGEVCTYIGEDKFVTFGYNHLIIKEGGHLGKNRSKGFFEKVGHIHEDWMRYYWVSEDHLTPYKPKKVTDLGHDEAIHCETEEEAKRICKLMHDAGLKWCTGKRYIEENSRNHEQEKTCYNPKKGEYCDIDYYKGQGYTIHPSTDFVSGEEIVMGFDPGKPGGNVSIVTYGHCIDGNYYIKDIKELYNTNKPLTFIENTMTKLQEFRNKMYFTDKKLQSLAELTEEAGDVRENLTNVIRQLENLYQSVNQTSYSIDGAVDTNNKKDTKHYEKKLKALLKKIKEDKTLEVILASGEVLEKFNESI